MADSVREVRSVCGQDCVLHCAAKEEPGVQYQSVRWYKVKHVSGFFHNG